MSIMDQVGNTRSAFARSVLAGIGAPVTQQNMDFMMAWMAREGTKAAFNPLATTLNYGGGTGFNSVGVKNYPDFKTGVGATVQTLMHSGYDDIVAALQGGNGAWNASHGLSRWSGGGYSSLSGKGADAALGGAGSLGANSAGATDTGSAAAAPVDPKQYAQEKYGYLAAYLDEPEIGPLILQAASEGWDINRLQGALFQTQWWKSHSDATRTWQALVNTDPATANARINTQAQNVLTIASNMGFSMSVDRATQIAESALAFGWSDHFLQWTVAAETHYDPTKGMPTGSIGSAADQVKALAGDYLVPFSDADAFKWGQDIASGNNTIDGAKAMMQNLALGRFPQLADILKSGVTPGQYFSPYKQLIAQQLEISPDGVDLLNNPKWMQVTSFNDNGTIRPMTLSETAQLARSQPEYKATKGGQQQASSVAEFIDKAFGKVMS